MKLELPEQVETGKERATRRKWLPAVIAAVLVVLLLAIGVLPRLNRTARAAETAKDATDFIPVVNVVPAKFAGKTSELLLPGNTEPINVARIYARASGYVRERRADIGTPVKSGQVLAIIESPELDQQLEQARADLQQARATLEQTRATLEQARAGVNQANANITQAQANEEIASTTNDRWTRLVSRGVLPKQAGDERRTTLAARQAETQASLAASKTAEATVNSRSADVLAAQAAINAQIANVHRLERMQAYEKLLAPFDGVVTERKVEKGDLVAADSGGDRNLFSVAQGKTLRIQVNVPQAYSVDLKQGQEATVLIRERPGQKFTGVVARTAQSLNSSSRTLLSEVQVDNTSGDLLPGMYAEVKFVLPRGRASILVPASALVANAQGTRVMSVSSDGCAHFVDVLVGRDFGPEVEILTGLKGNERLVANPADTLNDGQQVQIAGAKKKESKS